MCCFKWTRHSENTLVLVREKHGRFLKILTLFSPLLATFYLIWHRVNHNHFHGCLYLIWHPTVCFSSVLHYDRFTGCTLQELFLWLWGTLSFDVTNFIFTEFSGNLCLWCLFNFNSFKCLWATCELYFPAASI